MDSKYYIVILAIVAVIAILPLAMYSGLGEEEGYFSGADDAAGTAIEETGYEPWFSSIWEPPSGEIESLLFALQAAIGAAQMEKLPEFCEKRKANFKHWTQIFSKYPQYFILPEATENSDPAWFAFIVTLQKDCPFKRDEITRFLNEKLIETRNLFAGNMAKQPAFVNKNWRMADHLENTDYIMNNTFFLGTYPGLTTEMFDYVESVLEEFVSTTTK